MKYCVANGRNITEIEREVKKYLDAGWTPLGGISVSVSAYEYEVHEGKEEARVVIYAQALVYKQELIQTSE